MPAETAVPAKQRGTRSRIHPLAVAHPVAHPPDLGFRGSGRLAHHRFSVLVVAYADPSSIRRVEHPRVFGSGRIPPTLAHPPAIAPGRTSHPPGHMSRILMQTWLLLQP